MPSAREVFGQVRDAYVRWYQDLPVQLWLTVNAREGLWPGSWRFVLDQARELVEDVAGVRNQTAWEGVCEENADRGGYHLHALGIGPPEMRGPRRTGVDGLIPLIAALVEPLNASYRTYRQDRNAAMVQLKPVRRYGNGHNSLVAYSTKTLHMYVRKDANAGWVESGDVGRFLSQRLRLS